MVTILYCANDIFGCLVILTIFFEKGTDINKTRFLQKGPERKEKYNLVQLNPDEEDDEQNALPARRRCSTPHALDQAESPCGREVDSPRLQEASTLHHRRRRHVSPHQFL
jgi:hypothetical protein